MKKNLIKKLVAGVLAATMACAGAVLPSSSTGVQDTTVSAASSYIQYARFTTAEYLYNPYTAKVVGVRLRDYDTDKAYAMFGGTMTVNNGMGYVYNTKGELVAVVWKVVDYYYTNV